MIPGQAAARSRRQCAPPRDHNHLRRERRRPRVTDALNVFRPPLDPRARPVKRVNAEFQADVHKQMQRRQKGDDWWIRDVASRGMAILTQDRAILDDVDERQAITASTAIVFALAKGDYTVWDKFRCVARNWSVISERLPSRDRVEWFSGSRGPRDRPVVGCAPRGPRRRRRRIQTADGCDTQAGALSLSERTTLAEPARDAREGRPAGLRRGTGSAPACNKPRASACRSSADALGRRPER